MASKEGISLQKAFSSPDDLVHFSVNSQAYLQRHTQYQQLAVGALVFHGNRMLLVQRATTERAFPNRWEVPGGSVDLEDETILHAVARELLEETGLHAVAVVHEVGTGVTFGTAETRWLKLAFEVVVAEQEAKIETEAIPIKLDPLEHQDFLWVEEDDIRRGECNGIRLDMVTEDQRGMMLEGFRLRRERA